MEFASILVFSDAHIASPILTAITPCADRMTQYAWRAGRVIDAMSDFSEGDRLIHEHLYLLQAAAALLKRHQDVVWNIAAEEQWQHFVRTIDEMWDVFPLLKPLQFMMEDLCNVDSLSGETMLHYKTALNKAIQYEVKSQHRRLTHIGELGCNMVKCYGAIRSQWRSGLRHVAVLRCVKKWTLTAEWTKTVLELMHIDEAVRRFQVGERAVRHIGITQRWSHLI